MIQIKPSIEHQSTCPHCGSELRAGNVLWQGIHVCAVSTCGSCKREVIGDLPVGHGAEYPYQIDKENSLLFGPAASRGWLGEPLLRSLRSPSLDEMPLQVRKFSETRHAVLLNCIDFLYGHSLLKLLNAERHLRGTPEYGLIVIVPKFLAWLVPQGAAEAWIADLPLSKARNFYPRLDEQIKIECRRFETVFVSRALSHPKQFDISTLTGVKKHAFDEARFRVTFVWREDRLWCGSMIATGGLRRAGLRKLALLWQKLKVIALFRRLREHLPEAMFTVVGLGTAGRLPGWIEDCRTREYSEDVERRHCRIYAESRLIVGVHGSSMLLPSGLGGLTIDLMPDARWGNFGQDILYQEGDPRVASFRYRFLPIGIEVAALARIALSQVQGYRKFARQMSAAGA
jgi:hypothetical protein